MKKWLPILFSFMLLFQFSRGQESLPVPRNIKKAYTENTRSTDGKPGENYWQNKGNYKMDVDFNPVTRKITGKEEIIYRNQSPDTLNELIFKLFGNIYQKGAPRDESIAPEDVTKGVVIKNLRGNDEKIDDDAIHITGTTMRVTLPEGIAPGQEQTYMVEWTYIINKDSHNRMGAVDDRSFFIAYFFPRIAVYDDIDGWDLFNYKGGTQEFYNDFNDFEVHITVPKDYIVWATGTLQNSEEVLNSKFVKRIEKAGKSDEIRYIVKPEDLNRGNITRQKDKNTWKFQVEHITDFAFALSNHYVWESTSVEVDPHSKRRTQVNTAYNPAHSGYDKNINYARQTVEKMSHEFPAWPFPYPHMTVFDGLDKMEYPMMANDVHVEDVTGAITLTVHEIFHTMMPFYMGTNETKYSFMDEGWATLGEWLFSPEIDTTAVDDFGMEEYNQLAGTEEDLPIMTKSTYLPGVVLPSQVLSTGMAYFLNSYPKAGLGYLYVKDMLGDELFKQALHHFFENWNGKHPIPWDFYTSMNEGSGKNLNWFWKRWFFDNGYPDLGIEDVQKTENGYLISIQSIGSKPTPINLTLKFEEGQPEKIHRSIAVWEKSDRTTVQFDTDKTLIKVELGSQYDADIDKSNNYFEVE